MGPQSAKSPPFSARAAVMKTRSRAGPRKGPCSSPRPPPPSRPEPLPAAWETKRTEPGGHPGTAGSKPLQACAQDPAIEEGVLFMASPVSQGMHHSSERECSCLTSHSMKGQSQMSAPRLTKDSPRQNLPPPSASCPFSSTQCDSLGVISRKPVPSSAGSRAASVRGTGSGRPVATLAHGREAEQGKGLRGSV